eukprot:COSAG01_NODE_1052_length_11920_cov_6.553760_3_plen_283_part_00
MPTVARKNAHEPPQRPKQQQQQRSTTARPSASPSPSGRAIGVGAVARDQDKGKSNAVPLLAGVIVIAAIALMYGKPSQRAAGRSLSGEGALAKLGNSLGGHTWAHPKLMRQVQHKLVRGGKNGGAVSMVVGGGRGAAGSRTEFIDGITAWVGASHACDDDRSWLIEVDGGELVSNAQLVLAKVEQQQCPVTVLLVRNAQKASSDTMQIFEPLLSGEGPQTRTEVVVLLDVETTAMAGGGEQPTGQCSAKDWGCAQSKLQQWVMANIWKRRGLVGRITMWIAL